jgi:hypothetical protein
VSLVRALAGRLPLRDLLHRAGNPR